MDKWMVAAEKHALPSRRGAYRLHIHSNIWRSCGSMWATVEVMLFLDSEPRDPVCRRLAGGLADERALAIFILNAAFRSTSSATWSRPNIPRHATNASAYSEAHLERAAKRRKKKTPDFHLGVAMEARAFVKPATGSLRFGDFIPLLRFYFVILGVAWRRPLF